MNTLTNLNTTKFLGVIIFLICFIVVCYFAMVWVDRQLTSIDSGKYCLDLDRKELLQRDLLGYRFFSFDAGKTWLVTNPDTGEPLGRLEEIFPNSTVKEVLKDAAEFKFAPKGWLARHWWLFSQFEELRYFRTKFYSKAECSDVTSYDYDRHQIALENDKSIPYNFREFTEKRQEEYKAFMALCDISAKNPDGKLTTKKIELMGEIGFTFEKK